MTAPIHGNLGSVSPSANTDTDLYNGGAVPAGRKATGTLTICNTNPTDVTVRFAIVNGAIASVATSDYREYETTVSKVLEKTAIPLAAGFHLLVRASAANVAFNFDGIEEDA